MKKLCICLLTLGELFCLHGCGTTGAPAFQPPPPPPPPASATHFSVSAPANSSVGTAFDFTVKALDASNNTFAGYSGTVHFTSSDGHAELPADSLLTNGTSTLPAGLKATGTQTITATDTVNASITGVSNSIKVTAAAPDNPVPFLNQPLSPDATVPGGGDFIMTVNGTGFVPGSVVNWNGKSRGTSFVSASKLMATILTADIASFATASLTVSNPAPGGGTSNVVFFQATRPTAAAALKAPADFSAGSSPVFVTTGDFNGDGKLDIAVANRQSNNVSVLLGNGDGTFQAAVNYTTGSGPHSVAVGDFNGDGKLDLAVANASDNTVSVLLGKGDGTFQPATAYGVGSSPQSLAVADFNSDGKLDLVAANSQSNNVSVLLGNGDGTFQAALNFAADLGPSSVALGDFNGDGILDLAVANFASTNISILLGNGDGTFQPAVNYAAGGGCQSVAVADLNGDGKLDLAVANSTTNDVSILLGKGDGTFLAATNFNVGAQPQWLAVGDFDGDGSIDVAVANSGNGNVSILSGNGDGTFQQAISYDIGMGSESLAVGDFNGDGRLDVVATIGSASTTSVLLQPALVSGPNATWSFPISTFPDQVVGKVSAAQPAVLLNYGTAALDITSISASANFGETNTCGSSLAPRAACTVLVTFSPSSVGTVNGNLTVSGNAPGGPQSVSLIGTGTNPQSEGNGYCVLNQGSNTLTGQCFTTRTNASYCKFTPDPAHCPTGAKAISPGTLGIGDCGLIREVRVDTGRRCP
jgi:hypothetical protein